MTLYMNLPMAFKLAIDISAVPTLIYTITNFIRAVLPDDIENVVIPIIAMALGGILYYGIGANPMEGIMKGLEAIGVAITINLTGEARDKVIAHIAAKKAEKEANVIKGG